MRRLAWTSVLGFALISAISGTAAAADRLNDAGRFVVSGERLFGVGWTKDTATVGNTSSSSSVTSISLLTKPVADPFSSPRIAFDYFVIEGLSLGGALGYANYSVSQSTMSTTQDLTSFHTWLLAPRIGYAYMFTDVVGLWPRAGVTYVDQSFDNGADEHFWALSVEAPLAITPVPHVLITIAPTFDWGFSGSASLTSTLGNAKADLTAISLGLHAGLGIWF